MKINSSPKFKTAANALLATIVTTALMGASVMGYLTLIEQENFLSARSQSWNMAIAVTEAGIEDGLQQLNSNPNQLGNDGWTFDGTLYHHSYTNSDGNSYSVSIDSTTDSFHPTVFSTASVNTPSIFEALRVSPLLGAVGVDPTQSAINRSVRVKTQRGALFIKAMVAKHRIDMNGNSIQTDSFNSLNPAYSGWFGRYDPTPGKTSSNGDVATNDALTNAVSSGNANIYGHVATGPGGSVAVGPNGGVGDQTWVAAHAGQVESGYFADNSNFTFPDNPLPNYANALTPTSGWVTNAILYMTTNFVSTNINNPQYAPGTPISYPFNSTGPFTYTTNKYTTASYMNPGSYFGSPSPEGNSGKTNYQVITSYTYYLYVTNIAWTNMYYDNILVGGPSSSPNNYQVSSLSGKTIVLGGQVNLVVTGGLSMGGNDSITIVGPPSGSASLVMYSGGTSCHIAGNGIINEDGHAASFILYCAPSVTSFTLDGNGGLIGVVSAPEADAKLNGGGSSSIYDLTGAIIANTVTMNGHFNFHYDESLGALNGNGRTLAQTWDEIFAGH